MLDSSTAQVKLGYISGIHGFKGWVKVFSYTDPRESIGDYRQWWLGQKSEPVAVVGLKRHAKTIIAQLQGIDTPELARALVSLEITVPRNALAAVPDRVFYWVDLIGLEVVTTQGQSLGRVEKMIETGANDVMVVTGERERLVPFVMGQYVKQVDADNGRIDVDWDPDF